MVQYYYNQGNSNNRFEIKTDNYKFTMPEISYNTFSTNEPKVKRGALDRIFDVLNVGQYVSAGFAQGMVDDNITPFEGMVQGIMASNPFGQGYEKGEHSYSKVLETAGWKPETFGGKVVKGATGFVADILLDPMTYVSGGLSGIVKGSGKAGVKTTLDVADKLGDSAKFIDTVGDISKTTGITQEIAEKIVMDSKLYKSGKSTIDVAEEGARLMDRYNKLIGVNSKSAEVTLSLANAPFGKKIFGKHADKSLTLFDSDVVKAFGDSTVAPMYSKLRDGIYGSKIGELFAPTHVLFKNSRTRPDEVYNFMKMNDFKVGTGKGKMEAERLIRKNAQELLNLTPAEANEVLESMQDKTIMHKVSEMIDFFDTKEAMMHKQKLEAGRKATQESLDDIINNYDVLEDTIKKSTDDISIVNKQIEAVKKQKSLELLNINNKHVKDLDRLEDVIYQYEKMSNELKPYSPENLENIRSKWNGLTKTIDSKNADKFNLKSVDDISELMYGNRDIIKTQSSDSLNSILNSLTNGGKANVTSEAIDELVKLSKNSELGEISKDSVEKYLSVFKTGDRKAVYMEMVDELSDALFGKKGMISYDTYDSSINKIFEMSKKGAGQEELVNYIFANKELYTGQASEMYSFIANQIGYGGKHKHKNWESIYTKPMEEIFENYNKTKSLTREQMTKLADLQQMKLKRDLLLNEFKDIDSAHGMKKAIADFKGELLTPSVEEIRDKLYNSFNNGKSIDDVMRDGFMMELAKDDYTGGTRKGYHKSKTFDTDIKLNQSDRDLIFDHYLDKFGKRTLFVGDVSDVSIEKINQINLEVNNKIKNNVAKVNELTGQVESIKNNIKNSMRDSNDISDSFLSQMKEQRSLQTNMEKEIKDLLNQNKELRKMNHNTITKTTELTSKTQAKKFNQYIDDLEIILQKEGIQFGSIDIEDREKFFNMAERYRDSDNVNDAHSALREHIDEIKKSNKAKAIPKSDNGIYKSGKTIINGKVVDIPKEINTLDDISDVPELFDRFVMEKYDTKLELEKAKSKIASISSYKAREIEKVTTTFDEALTTLETSRVALEGQLENLLTKLSDLDPNAYSAELAGSVSAYNDILNNSDAFETYVRIVSPEGTFDNIDAYNSNVGDYILDINDKLSPKSKEVVEKMRKDFMQMATDEVEIGKLDIGQLEANKFDYLPHILTPEGEKLFANKDIQATIAQFDDGFGYGKEFNPHAKSRTIKVLPDGHGGWIDKPTIQEINDYFKEFTGGKNVFSEDLSEIYLARALKHSDLMYDNKYMENMLELFGDDYTGTLKEGYSVAMNYGMLKKTTSEVSRGHTALDISDAISDFLTTNEIFKLAENEAEMLWQQDPSINTKKIKNDIITKHIDNFMKTELTDEVRHKLYAKNLDDFLTQNNTFGLLDEMALPLTSMDDAQIKSMNDSVDALRKRLDNHIRKNIASLTGTKLEGSPIMGMSMDDISEFISDSLKGADEIDANRLNRIAKRVKEFNDLKDPQIKQVQNAIVEKANMSRQLQITRDSSDLLTMYDKFTHFVKLQQTAVLPGFHGRNKQSNMFNNWLAVGQDAVDIDFQKSAYKALTGSDKAIDDMLEIVSPDGSKKLMSWKEIFIEAENYGAIDKGIFATEIGATAKTQGLLNRFIPGKFDPTDTGNFLPYQIGTRVGNTIENHDRLIHFASQVKNGMSFQDASESVNKFLFDYGELTSFEHNVMKRIFPYYTWMRKNGALQLEMMLEQPEKYRMVSKVMGGIENLVDDDKKINKFYVNEFAQDWIQTPFKVTNPDGRKEPVLWNPNLPFMDIGRIPDPTKMKDSMQELFTQTNPLIKLPVELAMNRNLFFDSPITKEDESRIGKSIKHVGGQFGVVPIAEGLANKTGTDLGLHIMNNTTGIKFLSYDYDKYKAIKIQELSKKRTQSNSNPGIMDSIKRRLGKY